MEMLREGSRGDAVEALQKKLLGQGVNPGPIDGIFGHKTEEALRRFQEREGLEVDGIAGPKTFAAIGLMEAEPEVTEVAEVRDLSDLVEEIEGKQDEPGGTGGSTTI